VHTATEETKIDDRGGSRRLLRVALTRSVIFSVANRTFASRASTETAKHRGPLDRPGTLQYADVLLP
jgi:hypothetical protein